MLKIKDNVDLKELEKYGFTILVDDKELEKRTKKDPSDYYCSRAFKDIGHHFTLVIEIDEYYNQITIIPNNEFPMKLSISWQLDLLYDLIKADLVEKVDD